MSADRQYIEANDRERTRLRALVDRLTDEELKRKVDERWTVADVLGHIAFWDSRSLYLAGKLERGEPFIPDDHEPDDVEWINQSAWSLIRALPPRAAAQLALRQAEAVDTLVARVDPARCWPADPESPLNPNRASHRGEHLDQVEEALAD